MPELHLGESGAGGELEEQQETERGKRGLLMNWSRGGAGGASQSCDDEECRSFLCVCVGGAGLAAGWCG